MREKDDTTSKQNGHEVLRKEKPLRGHGLVGAWIRFRPSKEVGVIEACVESYEATGERYKIGDEPGFNAVRLHGASCLKFEVLEPPPCFMVTASTSLGDCSVCQEGSKTVKQTKCCENPICVSCLAALERQREANRRSVALCPPASGRLCPFCRSCGLGAAPAGGGGSSSVVTGKYSLRDRRLRKNPMPAEADPTARQGGAIAGEGGPIAGVPLYGWASTASEHERSAPSAPSGRASARPRRGRRRDSVLRDIRSTLKASDFNAAALLQQLSTEQKQRAPQNEAASDEAVVELTERLDGLLPPSVVAALSSITWQADELVLAACQAEVPPVRSEDVGGSVISESMRHETNVEDLTNEEAGHVAPSRRASSVASAAPSRRASVSDAAAAPRDAQSDDLAAPMAAHHATHHKDSSPTPRTLLDAYAAFTIAARKAVWPPQEEASDDSSHLEDADTREQDYSSSSEDSSVENMQADVAAL